MFKRFLAIIALSSLSLSLSGMEEGELLEIPTGHKRKHDQTTQKVKKRKLTSEECYALWLKKIQPVLWEKVEKSTCTKKLSNESLFYFMNYVPNEVQQIVADEFMREHIEPYYIGSILNISLKLKSKNKHTEMPEIVPVDTNKICLQCNRNGGCRIGFEVNIRGTHIEGQKITSGMYHQNLFANKICAEYFLSNKQNFVVEDDQGGLIISCESNTHLYELEGGKICTDKRNQLVGKIDLFHTVLLYQSQIAPKELSEDQSDEIRILKKLIRTICKDKTKKAISNESDS